MFALHEKELACPFCRPCLAAFGSVSSRASVAGWVAGSSQTSQTLTIRKCQGGGGGGERKETEAALVM